LSLSVPEHKGVVEIRLSDVLEVTLTVDGRADLEVKAPRALTTAENWKVESPTAPIVISLERDRHRWRQLFLLYPLAPGRQVLDVQPLLYRERRGEWTTVNWKPIVIEVATSVTQADARNLRDITPIEEVPEPGGSGMGLWLAAGAAAVVLGVVVLLLWHRRRRPAPASLTPRQSAFRELDRISALKLPDAGEVERFHTMLSNVIRRFLENCYGLPARRQTTPEFLRAMNSSNHLSPPQRALLHDFLDRCDLAKFAGDRPTSAKCRETEELARKIISSD
jgi:hypothetical protein